MKIGDCVCNSRGTSALSPPIRPVSEFVEEPTMTKSAKAARPWTKPEIKRLGDMKDVAGKETPLAQASATKS